MRITFIALLLSVPVMAAEKSQVVVCPLKITVSFKPEKGIPTMQFRNSETSEIEFQNLAMFDQDPKKKMPIKPDNDGYEQPHTWTIKQEVSKDDNSPGWQKPAGEKSATITPWLVCYYGKNSKQLFVKRFAKVPQSCTTQASKTNAKVFNTVVCQ